MGTRDIQVHRAERSEFFVPLYPVLYHLVLLRKHLAERTLLAIREARQKVEAREARLPLLLLHPCFLPTIVHAGG